MLNTIKKILKLLNFDTTKLYHDLSAASLEQACREQKLSSLREDLRRIAPDISGQYTTDFDATEYERYWERKMRGLHAFQVDAALRALEHIGRDGLVLADIGDSSGNHTAYIRALAPKGRVERAISLNLDPVAVEKIRMAGGEAILCRAEELDTENIRADLFMSFQMLEHLTDPIRFLHLLAEKGSANHLLFTVPWRRHSRFGGWHLRQPESEMPVSMTAEEVHVYEFSPMDWTLLARFAGWRPISTRYYRQYALRNWSSLTAPLWAKVDHEGFIAILLERDLSLARRYTAW